MLYWNMQITISSYSNYSDILRKINSLQLSDKTIQRRIDELSTKSDKFLHLTKSDKNLINQYKIWKDSKQLCGINSITIN